MEESEQDLPLPFLFPSANLKENDCYGKFQAISKKKPLQTPTVLWYTKRLTKNTSADSDGGAHGGSRGSARRRRK